MKSIKKLSNFKSSGLDGVQNIFIKNLSNLFPSLKLSFEKLLDTCYIPDWMLKGKTTLIQKKPTDEFQVGNYRPITCLLNFWKLLSSCISESIYSHFSSENIFPFEQKGCIKRTLGTVDQLLIDKNISKHAHQNKRNLYVPWIDYRKAFDSVSHDWIFKCFSIFKVNEKLKNFLSQAFNLFKTSLTYKNVQIGSIDIKQGIYQGDSLSPLLFIMTLIPLSTLLNKQTKGYTIGTNKNKEHISHLLFVDDIKLYATSEKNLKNLLHTTERFSNDVGLHFGFPKCSITVMKKGVPQKITSILMNEGVIHPLQEEYKYLGINQTTTTLTNKSKEELKDKYFERLEHLLKTKLS